MEFKTNTLYTINLNYNTCTVTNLTQPWQNHTIPTDATLEDEYELGAPGSGFRVREWSDRLPARRGIKYKVYYFKGKYENYVIDFATDNDNGFIYCTPPLPPLTPIKHVARAT